LFWYLQRDFLSLIREFSGGKLKQKGFFHSVGISDCGVNRGVISIDQAIPECPTYTVTLPLQHPFFLLTSANTQTKPDNESLWGAYFSPKGPMFFISVVFTPFPPTTTTVFGSYLSSL
jgi:hypothetical protein